MADIGIRAEADNLVLWRGRDFKWTFENLDVAGEPENYPEGRLFFEIQSGGEHNAIQSVAITKASGGTYKLGVLGELSAGIDYYDVTSAPYDMGDDVTDALEALTTVGAGNVLVHPASLYPAWNITLELNAGANEIQEITFTGGPNGGTFKLGYGSAVTGVIAYGATPAVVETALESIPAIGSGNVTVSEIPGGYRVEFVGTLENTNVPQIVGYSAGIDFALPAWYFGLTGAWFPQVQTHTVLPGSAKLTEQLVNTLNKTINDFFNSFETLLGVDIEFRINDALNATLTVTSLKSFQESDLITFAVDVTSNALEGVVNNVAALFGVIETFHVDFYWNHIYDVEFVGALANTPIPKMTKDIALLTGLDDLQSVEVTVVEPGKDPLTIWDFDIDGATAIIKKESEDTDLIESRMHWQLVFLPDGELAGGDPVGRGRTEIVGD